MASGTLSKTKEIETPSKFYFTSGSGKSSTGDNKREQDCEDSVFANFDDIDSDVEDKGGKSKKPMVEVKVEKEE
uniref:Uncharacterized protein n=1 Tax=Tanacetum cinerariifolium TaxID=118510 RepID=A0A699JZH1_TANCI|nr:hypothetical protein [Tanacetum cinerariifolium]